jgi:hypothetical protein
VLWDKNVKNTNLQLWVAVVLFWGYFGVLKSPTLLQYTQKAIAYWKKQNKNSNFSFFENFSECIFWKHRNPFFDQKNLKYRKTVSRFRRFFIFRVFTSGLLKCDILESNNKFQNSISVKKPEIWFINPLTSLLISEKTCWQNIRNRRLLLSKLLFRKQFFESAPFYIFDLTSSFKFLFFLKWFP